MYILTLKTQIRHDTNCAVIIDPGDCQNDNL